MSEEKVSFGYKTVSAGEKRKLVDEQFKAIARTYDLADALLSLGLHFLWKRNTIRMLSLKQGESVLDLCGGTADLALLAAKEIGKEGKVIVYDINRTMMEVGRQKTLRSGSRGQIEFIQGDAESMCFPDGSFDAVTVGFGVRNLVHLETGLRETFRVLKSGGRLAILEFSVPTAFLVSAPLRHILFSRDARGGKTDLRHRKTFYIPCRINPRFSAAGAVVRNVDRGGFYNSSISQTDERHRCGLSCPKALNDLYACLISIINQCRKGDYDF